MFDDEKEEAEKEETRKKIELKELQDKEDLKNILSTPEGIRFFKNFFEHGRLFRTCFDPQGTVMAFHEGKRNLALRVLDSIIEADPRKVAELMVNDDGF